MVQSSHPHVDEELLELYAMKKLTESELEPVEEHLLICEACQDRLTETENYIRTFRAAAEKLMHEPAPETMWSRWKRMFSMPRFAVVPALAGALAIAIFLGMPRSNPELQTAELRALRADSTVTVEAGRPVQLKLGAEGLNPQKQFRAELVSTSGATIWSGGTAWSSGWLTATVDKKLQQGKYWVRLFERGDNKQISEYRLVVQ